MESPTLLSLVYVYIYFYIYRYLLFTYIQLDYGMQSHETSQLSPVGDWIDKFYNISQPTNLKY